MLRGIGKHLEVFIELVGEAEWVHRFYEAGKDKECANENCNYAQSDFHLLLTDLGRGENRGDKLLF